MCARLYVLGKVIKLDELKLLQLQKVSSTGYCHLLPLFLMWPDLMALTVIK